MRSRHPCQFGFMGKDKLSIDFTGFNESQHKDSNGAGVAAMKEVLQKEGLTNPEDFEIKTSGFPNGENSQIVIKRPANIIVILHYLLVNSKTKDQFFDLLPGSKFTSSIDPRQDAYKQAISYYLKVLVGCIGSERLSKLDAFKATYYIRVQLDSLYSQIKEVKLFKLIQPKLVENYGDNFLRHPFYQALSVLVDKYEENRVKYNTKSFFKKNSYHEQNIEPYLMLFNGFINFVPDCYCNLTPNSSKKILNQLKLKKSREISSNEIAKTTVNNNNATNKQTDPAISAKSPSSKSQEVQKQNPYYWTVIDLIEKQETKSGKQQCLKNWIAEHKFTVEQLKGLYNDLRSVEGLNNNENPTLDCLLGIRNTASWRDTLGEFRSRALSTLFEEVDAIEDKQDKLNYLVRAKTVSLFAEHRNNSIFAGAFGRTASVKKIEDKIEEIEQQSLLR